MQVQNIHYRTMGRCFRVTAMFTSDEAANRYMKDHPHEGVIASFGRQVLLADVRDKGNPVQSYVVPQGPTGIRRVASIDGAIRQYANPPVIQDTCEICGNHQDSCWPVAINGDDQNIRKLCDGCAAMDLDAAWVIDMLKREEG